MTEREDELLRGELRECHRQLEELEARRRGPPDEVLESEIRALERRAAEIIQTRAERRLLKLRARARARSLLGRKTA